jgi:hypothetical protein
MKTSWPRALLILISGIALLGCLGIYIAASFVQLNAHVRPHALVPVAMVISALLLVLGSVGPDRIGEHILSAFGVNWKVREAIVELPEAERTDPRPPDELSNPGPQIEAVNKLYYQYVQRINDLTLHAIAPDVGINVGDIKMRSITITSWQGPALTNESDVLVAPVAEIEGVTTVFEIIGLAQFKLRDRLFIRAQEVLGTLTTRGRLVLVFTKWWHSYGFENEWNGSIRELEEFFAPAIRQGSVRIKRVDVSAEIWQDATIREELQRVSKAGERV